MLLLLLLLHQMLLLLLLLLRSIYLHLLLLQLLLLGHRTLLHQMLLLLLLHLHLLLLCARLLWRYQCRLLLFHAAHTWLWLMLLLLLHHAVTHLRSLHASRLLLFILRLSHYRSCWWLLLLWWRCSIFLRWLCLNSRSGNNSSCHGRGRRRLDCLGRVLRLGDILVILAAVLCHHRARLDDQLLVQVVVRVPAHVVPGVVAQVLPQ